MSSILPAPQPSPNKTWWPRLPSKSSTISIRSGKVTTSIPRATSKPVATFAEKQEAPTRSATSKPISRFNILASAIGFRSKKNHRTTLAIENLQPSGADVLQSPPVRIRAHTVDGYNTVATMNSATPRLKSSVSTIQSSDDASEPLTPSEFSRNFSSFQATSSDHDPFAALVSRDTQGALRSPSSDYAPLSSISDSPMIYRSVKRAESSIASHRSSQTSTSSYGRQLSPAQQRRTLSSKMPSFTPPYLSGTQSPPQSPRSLHPDSLLSSPRDSATSTLTVISEASRQRTMSPALSAGTSAAELKNYTSHPSSVTSPERVHIDDPPTKEGQPPTAEVSLKETPPPSARSPQFKSLGIAASSVSIASNKSSHSSTASRLSVTVYPLNLTPSGSTPSLLRQASVSRLRNVGSLPPTPAPPPTQQLPPTPTASLMLSTGPKSAKPSSRGTTPNPAPSVDVEEQSILNMTLPPPSSPSSDAESSSSLSFANFRDHSSASSTSWRTARNVANARHIATSPVSRQPTSSNLAKPAHGTRPSTSSSALSLLRGETHGPKSLKKCQSQQSLGSRARAESLASVASQLTNDSNAIGHHGKTLTKQRSLHSTRAGLLASPPMPHSLRHASSFTSSGSVGVTPTKVDIPPQSSGGRKAGTSQTHSSSSAITPTTPQKKRTLFPHGVRNDSDQAVDERRREDGGESTLDRNKKGSVGRGLSLGLGFPAFSNPFSTGHHDDAVLSSTPPHSPTSFWESASIALPPPPAEVTAPPEHLGEHILPPAELLSRIEALSETQPPPSPPQFADVEERNKDVVDDDWIWGDTASVISHASGRQASLPNTPISPQRPPHSRKSVPALSKAVSTHHFMSPASSIHERLESGSSLPRLPTRRSTRTATASISSTKSTPRPATQPISAGSSSKTPSPRDENPSTSLPPPPRRPGSAVTRYSRTIDVPLQALSPAPSRSRRPQRVSSKRESQRRNSMIKKSSFLNIDDDNTEPVCSPSPPTDSFLDLERGQNSLDLLRSSEDGQMMW